MNLTLLQCHPQAEALAAWATREGSVSPDGDYGYALHLLLTAAFGDDAPKTFRFLRSGGGLLGYTQASVDKLMSHVSLATPDVHRILNLSTLAARNFPCTWRSGQRLSFEVRVRPIVRGKSGERDAFLQAIEQRSEGTTSVVQREEIYRHWLTTQLQMNGASTAPVIRMKAFQFRRVVRRSHETKGRARSLSVFSGPDALMAGVLEVGDGAAFSAMLARGVGRHRAFGFGMLMLRPAD
jgi:CRISPR system Cascade subunit CasE